MAKVRAYWGVVHLSSRFHREKGTISKGFDSPVEMLQSCGD